MSWDFAFCAGTMTFASVTLPCFSSGFTRLTLTGNVHCNPRFYAIIRMLLRSWVLGQRSNTTTIPKSKYRYVMLIVPEWCLLYLSGTPLRWPYLTVPLESFAKYITSLTKQDLGAHRRANLVPTIEIPVTDSLVLVWQPKSFVMSTY